MKTTVRLVGHPSSLASFDDVWLTDRIRRTCQIGEDNGHIEVLGAALGPASIREAQFSDFVGKLRDLHASLAEIADPAAELTLGRACVDVSRVVHLLRASGDVLSSDATAEHDEALTDFVSTTLGGDLPVRSSVQAAAGVSHGGLGMRRAADLALPCFVASRVEARPFVERLFSAMDAEGVGTPGLMELYDSQVENALRRLEAQLTPGRAERARGFCERAAEVAIKQLDSIEAGGRLSVAGAPVGVGQAGSLLLGELGAEDSEHPASAAASRPRLQRALAGLVDRDCLDALAAGLDSQSDLRRLKELRDDTVSSEWLWALDPRAPAALEPDAYVAAVRLRLGAGFAPEPLVCHVCRGTLDPGGSHALCCAPGESTRGHNDVRDAVFDLAYAADATAEKEVLGLLATAPGLRPADILTSAAAPGLVSALDIGVASPDAQHAGQDCTEAMRVRKRGVYARHLEALHAEGVEYRPLVWSCWGQEHPDTTAALTAMARRAARRHGVPDHAPLLRRARAQVGAALARRAAAMLRACMPGAEFRPRGAG